MVRLTAGGPLLRGDRSLPPTYAIEILAEAAIFLVRETAAEAEGATVMYLGGISDATISPTLTTRPLVAGDSLDMRIETTRSSFGRMRKLHGVMLRDGEPMVEADLILVAGS